MPVTSPVDAIAGVRRRIRDENPEFSGLGTDADEAIDLAIQACMAEYAQDRPYLVVADLTGNGTPFYSLALLTGYVQDWSRIRTIEYPAQAPSATYNPIYLDPVSDWREDYQTASLRYLWLIGRSPSASETIRVTYTVLRTLTESTDTTISVDREAILDLATSYLCRMLATQAAQTVDSDAGSEYAAPRDAQLKLAEQEKRWRSSYERAVSKGEAAETSLRAGFAVSDFDPKPKGLPARRWLTHQGRR